LVSVTVGFDQPTGAPGVPAAAKAIQWEAIGLGGGGAYMCIGLAQSDPEVIYVGGDVGGIWKSDDRGRSWRIRNCEAVHAIFPGQIKASRAVMPSENDFVNRRVELVLFMLMSL
jgi:hypothetical protein